MVLQTNNCERSVHKKKVKIKQYSSSSNLVDMPTENDKHEFMHATGSEMFGYFDKMRQKQHKN